MYCKKKALKTTEIQLKKVIIYFKRTRGQQSQLFSFLTDLHNPLYRPSQSAAPGSINSEFQLNKLNN